MSEYITDLNIGGYKILQDTDGYSFSQDSVLLANLCFIKPGEAVLDLGTGCGIIATLIAVKKNPERVCGIEILPFAANMAERSVRLNNLEDKIKIICGDVRDTADLVGHGAFDKVVCNPPYFDTPSGVSGQNSPRILARTESTASLEDFIIAAKIALKYGGDFYIIQKFNRLCDLIVLLRKHGLEPKHAILVYPKLSAGADVVILRARKGGKSGMRSETLIVMDEENNYTERIKELYR